MEAREVLEQVKSGTLTVEEAERYFRRQPYEEMGYAKLDTHREIRSGFPEVVFAAESPMNIWRTSTGKCMRKTGRSSEPGRKGGSTSW